MRSEFDRLARRVAGGDPGAAKRLLEAVGAGAFEASEADLQAIARALLVSSSEDDVRKAMSDAGVGLIERWSAVDRARGREPDLWSWKLVAYDVWGNAENGWDVNDYRYTGDEIVLPGDVSGEEAIDALAEAGLIKGGLEVEDWHEETITFSRRKDDKPVGEIRRDRRARLA